jgi:hypothetical protein
MKSHADHFSRPVHYKVAIKQPEEWKIRSVAQYKLRQKLKLLKQNEFELLQQKQLEALSLKEEGERNRDEQPKNINSIPEDQLSPAVATSSSSSSSKAVSKEDEEIDLKFEANVRELANCHFTSSVIKARIAALHSVRVSLLWLLKKSSLHERATINDHLTPSHP